MGARAPRRVERHGRASAQVAARPSIGPLPSTAELGRRLTALDPPRFRGAFAGQANAILLAPALPVLDRELDRAQRSRVSGARRRGWLGLPLVDELYWAKERRVCQAVRVRAGRRPGRGRSRTSTPPARRTSGSRTPRCCGRRRSPTRWPAPDEICVLAGDFNVTAERSVTCRS